MAMEVVPVKLPPELKEAMIEQAEREGKSHSAFMRDALTFYMQSDEGRWRQRWLASIDISETGTPDG